MVVGLVAFTAGTGWIAFAIAGAIVGVIVIVGDVAYIASRISKSTINIAGKQA